MHRHPGQNTSSSFYQSLFNKLNNYKYYLVLGDLNHTVIIRSEAVEEYQAGGSWWSLRTSIWLFLIKILSRIFLDFIYLSHRSGFIIRTVGQMCDFYVDKDAHGSDHFSVVTQIGAQIYFKSKLQVFLKKRGTWWLYRRLLSSIAISPPEEETDSIGRYNILVQSILDVTKSLVPEGFPRSNVQDKNFGPPW